ncbi:alkaline phosphatase [Lutibacter sp. HS1-25]|uniref:choice-of-anchor I family protein n=1 Tax=Lutibacter sp. HS1-25 TaxID=2485000 RepID=UPI0010104DE3|nr:choice-of-anchor I family protein [Lutibacter sp. HS1-25]RXP45930.1 alkaline phosphatase [Lutibacter sp. HS1-25]
MKLLSKLFLALLLTITFSCDKNDDDESKNPPVSTKVNFQYKATIKAGGKGASEITAFDPISNKIFVVNVESQQISVFNITNINAPVEETPISLAAYGSPNSVDINNGRLAIAVEDHNKQNPGKILLYNTENNLLINQFTVGSLPDMVKFTKNGKQLISANEGEPNDSYTVDPLGTVSIIDLETFEVTTLNFQNFNYLETALKNQGFRVFGPNATLAQDVEPEYIAVSEDSKIAWVALQENNGIAKIDLVGKSIAAIFPLGFKDYNTAGNEIDASDKDDVKELKKWPVKGMYQPDGIVAVTINGMEYLISANEGDSRDYSGFSEETRVAELTLDPTAFPESFDYQNNVNLGRLKTTNTLGDTDEDGDIDVIYSYGARSFTVWSPNANLIYDSGNSIATETLATTPNRFNDDDNRSDDKGAEPEGLDVLNINNERYILFVGLERNDQVMVYDITVPSAPVFLSILSHEGDEAPEGILAITAENSPTGKALLVVSNEDSGTISFYENN